MAQARPEPAEEEPSMFKQPETPVEPFPNDPRKLNLPPGETLMDFATSPTGAEIAILTRSPARHAHVLLWKIASGGTQSIWESDGHFAPRALAWHPAARVLFLLGPSESESSIARLEATSSGWKLAVIYHSKRPLRRLIAGPRPFSVDYEGSSPFYRVFFGETHPDGTSTIATVTERGDRYYELTKSRAAAQPPSANQDEVSPQQIIAKSALPEAFHPAGHILLWADDTRCFQAVHYENDDWGKSLPLLSGKLCGGSLEPTSNGIGLLHWRREAPGVDLYVSGVRQPTRLAGEYNFLSVPLSTPDGRGIIGATKDGNAVTMVYVPVDVPLANVSNAWMFLESPQDLDKFSKAAGLFRPQEKSDQLFQLYESEAYACQHYYTQTIPTRPYLVTTDIFWENFAAAYEGLFVLLERRQAIPIFWAFVQEADAALAPKHSRWAMAFHAVAQLQQPHPADPEAQRIIRASGVEFSSVLDRNFDFGELKPRGHYTASWQDQHYFQAFRYLTSISTMKNGLSAIDLQSLPQVAQEHARIWIRSYLPFIAPSRAPLVWAGLPSSIPAYVRHPLAIPTLFPLSFGFDNEVMLTTVFHPKWPPAERIFGPGGKRLLPSGLDVAAALGNPLARKLLAADIEKYPPLANALDALQARAPLASARAPENLYDRWLEALGTSWAEDIAIPGETDKDLWDTKRLQTGLASWATLRHATVLVNEREAAECGEAGFEFIQLTPPRGYVEPAPYTLDTIAGLFDAAADAVRNSPALEGGVVPSFPDAAPNPEETKGEHEQANLALRAGVLRRLGEAAGKARYFAGIARKELEGKPLSAHDYDQILYVARTAEYHFMIFKSLANPEFALSNPDPMAKIADVATSPTPNGIAYLHSGVGAPLEWDQIVPYFGRREIVKGSVYSYYEFSSPALLNDADWRARLAGQARPPWVMPFISNEVLSCPSKDPY